MPTSLVSTGVQFPDNSIQTTAASASVVFRNSRIFTLSTTFTPIVNGPHRITVIGAGGLGGGAYMGFGGGFQITGGGAGGLAQSVVTLSTSTTYTVTVPLTAVPFFSVASGNNGSYITRNNVSPFSASSFSGSGITTLTANAGEHGYLTSSTGSATTSAALGGTASGGQINVTGGSSGSITTSSGGFGCTGGGAVGWFGVGYSSGDITLSASTHRVATGGAGVGGGSAAATGTGTGSYVNGSNRFNVSGGGGSGSASTALGANAAGGSPATLTLDFYPTLPLLLNGRGGSGSSATASADTLPTSGTTSPTSTSGAGGGGTVLQGSATPDNAAGRGTIFGGAGGLICEIGSRFQVRQTGNGGGGSGFINLSDAGTRQMELFGGRGIIIVEWD